MARKKVTNREFVDANGNVRLEGIREFNRRIRLEKYGSEGGVYVVQCQQWFKIGIANNVLKRVISIQTGNPFDCVLVGFIPNEYEKTEKELHEFFKGKRGNGEWFDLDHKDYMYISESYNFHQIHEPVFNKENTGSMTIPFGNYKGHKLDRLVYQNPDYINWLKNNCYPELRQRYPVFFNHIDAI